MSGERIPDPPSPADTSDLPRGPYRFLAYAALIVGSSARFAHAVTVSIALVAVFVLSALLIGALSPLMPTRGRRFASVFLSSFIAACFQVLFSLYSPPLALDLAFFIGLVPVAFIASPVSRDIGSPLAAVSTSVRETMHVAALILAFSLVREILGYGCITFPTRSGALVLIGSDLTSSLSVRVLVSTAGGLMLLGYVLALLARSRPPSLPARPERSGE